jgi:hypothetical protein
MAVLETISRFTMGPCATAKISPYGGYPQHPPHSPSMTVLNARHIVLVEPVGANSKVAQLIAEDQQGNSK